MRKLIVSLVLIALAAPVFGGVPILTYSSNPGDLSKWWTTDVSVTVRQVDAGSDVGDIICDVPGITYKSSSPLVFTVSNEGITPAHCVSNTFDRELVHDLFLSIKIDKTPPRINFSGPALVGWNKTDTTLTITPSDFESEVVEALVNNVPLASPFVFEQAFTTDGVTQILFEARDAAGNYASRTESIRVDKTPPTMRIDIFPAPNADGWNNSPVTIRATVVDQTSGALDPPQNRPFNAEGTDIFTGFVQARDLAGNVGPLQELPHLNIDMTPPVITLTRDPLPNGNGWNNTNVTVHVTATDARSGLAGAPPSDTVLSDNRSGQFAEYSVFDKAGNRGDAQIVNINIDKNPPVVAFSSALPPPNANGWNNSDVRVTFGVTDQTIPPTDLRSSVDLTQEGTNLVASHVFTDLAGNSTTATYGGVNIDKTAPRFTASRFPLPNAHGWTNTDVTAHFEATDDLSGMDGKSSEDVIVTTPGANQVAHQAIPFVDRAGNRIFATLGGISIDKTPPSLVCAATPSSVWPPNHQLVPVTVSLFFDDGDEFTIGRSGGPDGPMPLVSVVSNAPKPGDIVGWAVGTEDKNGELLAWRAKDTPIYTFTYSASDFAGNTSVCTMQVLVGRN